jgi:hypothetical protein
MNFSSLDDVAIDKNRLLVMHPGDNWNSEEGVTSGSEIAKSRYQRDWSEVATQPLRSHETCSMEKILCSEPAC